MARTKDPRLAALKKRRQALSKRLWKAHVEGRFCEEMKNLGREAHQVFLQDTKDIRARHRPIRGAARATPRTRRSNGTRIPR